MSEASAAEEDTTFVPAAGMVEKPDKLPEINGPRYRTRDDFNHIPDHNIRRHAWQEYQRTIEEFRQAGTVQEKEREDFAPHFINPPGLHHVMFMAHAEALDEIKRWQEARAQHQAEQAAAAEEAERLRAVRQGLHDQIAARGEVAPVQAAPEAEIAESVDPATRLQRTKAQLWAKIAAAEQAREDARPAPAPAPAAPAPLPEPAPPALLRGVEFDPDAPSRIYRYQPKVPQLDVAPLPEALPPADDATETLLNAMIGECHFLMRAVTYPSMCHAGVAEDRMAWIDTAVKLAGMGAKVGKSIAHLRHGPAVRETRHTTTIVQNRVSAVAEVGGGG